MLAVHRPAAHRHAAAQRKIFANRPFASGRFVGFCGKVRVGHGTGSWRNMANSTRPGHGVGRAVKVRARLSSRFGQANLWRREYARLRGFNGQTCLIRSDVQFQNSKVLLTVGTPNFFHEQRWHLIWTSFTCTATWHIGRTSNLEVTCKMGFGRSFI